MMRNTYHTKRLVLCLSTPSLAAEVVGYYTRNAAFLREWEPERAEGFFTTVFHKRALSAALQNSLERTGFQFWLRLCGPEGRHGRASSRGPLIGMIALNSIVYGAFCSAYLSYKLDKAYLHQGLMGEALEKIIQIAFEELGLHRLEANILPRNQASLALVKKAGFREEGMARKYLRINGIWEDHLHMVRLNEEENIPDKKNAGLPVVREAVREDMPALLALYAQFKGETMPEPSVALGALWERVMQENQHILVVEEKGRLVATCTIIFLSNLNHDQRPYALIENVITDVNCRRKGYGLLALQYAVQIAIIKNCYKVMLMTGSKEEGTLAFYEKAGFNQQDKTAFVQWFRE